MKGIYVNIYLWPCLYLYIDNLQDVHPKIKRVYFGVVDIFVTFLYSTDFRKDKGKEGRQESRQGCWHWELTRIPMKGRDMK